MLEQKLDWPPPGVLERERELAAIEAAVDAAADGDGSLLVVEARAGLGKSRLVSSAAELGAARDLRGLHAQGCALEREHSMGVVLQLFGPAHAAADAAAREDLLGGTARLARPLLEGKPAAWGTSPDEHAFTLLHGLYWLTSNLAEQGPLLLSVDDAHWADRLSLRFLIYLAQRVTELPLVLLVSTRPREPGAHEDLLRRLKTTPQVSMLCPRRLSPAAAAAVVEQRMLGADDAFAAACTRVTDGNPFLLNELLADLSDRGVAPTAASAERVGALAPDSVLESVLVRLARLPASSADLAQAVAVLGDDARLRNAAELAGLDLAGAGQPLDALATAEMLHPGERLRFVHPLLQSAIYTDIPGIERAAMHARAARLLQSEGAPNETVAAHLLLSPLAGDGWTVERLREAATESLSRGAPESAAHYLERALDEPPAVATRPDVLLELGRAEALAGRGDAVIRMEGAVKLLPDRRDRAAALSDLGWMLQKRGDLGGAVSAFERGLAELEEAPEDDELAASIQLANLQAAHLGASLLDPATAGEAHRRVAQVLKRPGTDLTGVERGLLTLPAMDLMFSGDDHERVIELCLRAWTDGALMRQTGVDEPTIWHVSGMLAWADALDEAEEVIEAALAQATLDGSVVTQALALYARSWPRYWRGDIVGCAADAEAAMRAWSGDFTMYLPVAAYWLAMAQLELDEVDAAAETVRFSDAEERWGHTNMYGALVSGQALVALAQGDPGRAVERAEEAGKSVLGSLVSNPAVIPWRSYLALARGAAGDREGARESAREEVELARRFGAARPLGIALRTAGVSERGDAAVALLRESVEVLRRSPARFELARSLVELGAALRSTGRRAEAREPLEEGRALAQRFGAVVTERRACDELRSSGARPRRREASGIESLTPGERRVAELAGSGMTNREIAQSLFVTVKAVQFHLRNIYRKLEIPGRGELPAALEA